MLRSGCPRLILLLAVAKVNVRDGALGIALLGLELLLARDIECLR